MLGLPAGESVEVGIVASVYWYLQLGGFQRVGENAAEILKE